MDSRTKFLMWSERVKDRAELFDPNLSEAMTKVEGEEAPITLEKNTAMGIPVASSRELHGFLKDRTDGMAASVVRDNKSGVGLESWRQLCRNFNPRTLQGTLNAQHLETHPNGASMMPDLPKCMLEWEKNLRRCVQEGRTPPNDETKRLALLRMIPATQRKEIWHTANKLYPTFAELLAKVNEL